MSSLSTLLGDLDPASDRAVFRQISDRLREAIEAGRIAEGGKLPSEAELVDRYGVSRVTVRNALSVLRSEGLVLAEHGRGVFVRARPALRQLTSDRFSRLLCDRRAAALLATGTGHGPAAEGADVPGQRRAELPPAPEVDGVEVAETVPDTEIATRLGAAEKVLSRRRRYLLDGRPVELSTSYLPLDMAAAARLAEPDPGPGGVYAGLEELGHRLGHFEEEVRARMPSRAEARALHLTPGVPVIHLIRTAYDTEGRGVEVCETVMTADAHVLHYRLPAD